MVADFRQVERGICHNYVYLLKNNLIDHIKKSHQSHSSPCSPCSCATKLHRVRLLLWTDTYQMLNMYLIFNHNLPIT